jgi:hypothetical protein
MRRPSRSGLSLVFALGAIIPLTAQNLESIGRERPFSFAGGLSFNQIFYSTSGARSGRDPYSYLASGNLNVSLYGWSVPLSFSVSNHSSSYSQPFNQYSVHPTYKWVTAHAGYISMSLSPYTVNNHVFLGTALDLAPDGNWKLSALYGRFLKAVEIDTAQGEFAVPSFQRMGYALKGTLGNGRNFIDLIMFRAGDEDHSIQLGADSLGITPQQNLVLSIGGGKTIFKKFLLKAEVATSAITRNSRAPKTKPEHVLAKCGALFDSRLSSSYYNALKASFNYQQNTSIIGVGYERVDPGYRTLGAYYFNNDLENITLNASTSILHGELNVATSTGFQRDNLGNTKMSTMRRMVASVNTTYTPSQRFNVSSAYSSFQTYTNIRPAFQTLNQFTPYDNLDTLNFTQISRNASVSLMYTLQEGKSRKQNVNVHFTWQDAADRQGPVEQNSGTCFYNMSAGYAVTLVPENMQVAVTFNTSINQGHAVRSRMLGPNLSISSAYLDRKLRTTFSSSCNKAYSNGRKLSTVINNRVTGVFSVQNKHHVNMTAALATRSRAVEGRKSWFTELTAAVGYAYSLDAGGRRSKKIPTP